jgi:hypothetical protein
MQHFATHMQPISLRRCEPLASILSRFDTAARYTADHNFIKIHFALHAFVLYQLMHRVTAMTRFT